MCSAFSNPLANHIKCATLHFIGVKSFSTNVILYQLFSISLICTRHGFCAMHKMYLRNAELFFGVHIKYKLNFTHM